MSQLGGGRCRGRFGPDKPARFRWFEVLLKPEKNTLKSRCFRFRFLYNYHLFGIRGISLAKPSNNKQLSIEGSNQTSRESQQQKSISVGVLDTIGVILMVISVATRISDSRHVVNPKLTHLFPNATIPHSLQKQVLRRADSSLPAFSDFVANGDFGSFFPFFREVHFSLFETVPTGFWVKNSVDE